jgi:AcrR family transcriptional regulator
MSAPADHHARAGRPVDHTRDAAIMAATLELIQETGYDRLTMEAVAARAQAGKATLYRRWNSKAALVLDAVRDRQFAPPPLSDTGSIRSDLVSGLSLLAENLTDHDCELFIGLLGAMRTDAELHRLMGEQMILDKRAPWQALVDRALSRGELSGTPDADLLQEIVTAMFFGRLVMFRQPIDAAYIDHLVDDVVLPLLLHPTTHHASERTYQS